MATKTELEAELERLRAQNDLLRSQADETPDETAPDEPQAETDMGESLRRLLDEHGIDGEKVEALRTQLTDEFTKLQKEYPMAVILSVFVLGCIVGRTFK